MGSLGDVSHVADRWADRYHIGRHAANLQVVNTYEGELHWPLFLLLQTVTDVTFILQELT
jgi:hypothetical protein